MTKLPIWEVALSVMGPIRIRGTHELRVFKDFRYNDPFYSDIDIKTSDTGVDASVTVFASKNVLAHKAALTFFGQMLDSLALEIRQPLYLSITQTSPDLSKQLKVRRVVERDEWIAAFKESRALNEYEPTFLRALGWHRKGLYTEDPFDKFLAFWNSIEITASKYHTTDERTQKGSKNQIWQCFESIWGECKKWPVIEGNEEWININYNLRNDIAHGLKPVTVSSVESILATVNETEEVSYLFLRDWKKKITMDDHLSALLTHIGIESH